MSEIQSQVVELGRELKRLIHGAGIRLEDMSEDLGFHPHYLGRALRGRLPLNVEVVFRVLHLLKLEPDRFFEDMYPFGGPGMAVVLRKPSPGGGRDLSLRLLSTTLRRKRGEDWSPAALSKKAGDVLRVMLRRRGIRQRDASLALGLGPTALGQALRGYAELHFGHVFGVLTVCGAPHGRFVIELFGPADTTVLGRMKWLRALDYAERVVTGIMGTYAQRRGLLPVDLADEHEAQPLPPAEPGVMGQGTQARQARVQSSRHTRKAS